jgi:hypothetical protein
MTGDSDTIAPEPVTPDIREPLSSMQVEREPAFLARARRILTGDIHAEDYLTITPEVRRRMALFLEVANAGGNGQPLALEVGPQQLRQELLSFHHGG